MPDVVPYTTAILMNIHEDETYAKKCKCNQSNGPIHATCFFWFSCICIIDRKVANIARR